MQAAATHGIDGEDIEALTSVVTVDSSLELVCSPSVSPAKCDLFDLTKNLDATASPIKTSQTTFESPAKSPKKEKKKKRRKHKRLAEVIVLDDDCDGSVQLIEPKQETSKRRKKIGQKLFNAFADVKTEAKRERTER